MGSDTAAVAPEETIWAVCPYVSGEEKCMRCPHFEEVGGRRGTRGCRSASEEVAAIVLAAHDSLTASHRELTEAARAVVEVFGASNWIGAGVVIRLAEVLAKGESK